MKFLQLFLTIGLAFCLSTTVLAVTSRSQSSSKPSSKASAKKATIIKRKSRKVVHKRTVRKRTVRKRTARKKNKTLASRKTYSSKHRRVASKKKYKRTRKRKVVSKGVRVPARITSQKQLAYVISRVIKEVDSKAKVGVFAKSLETGKVLYVRNIYRPLVPASIMKILTAEAALLYLGSEYRFSTQLLTNAKGVKDGVLQGDLYIVLSGDPTLTYDDLVDLMANLQQEGISTVSGSVYIDNTAYDQSFYGPGWGGKDKNYCYGAPISASIINHNCLPLTVLPSRFSGRKAKVITSPRHFYPGIRNHVVTKASRARSCSFRLKTNPNSSITLDGCMRKGHRGSGVQYVVTDIPEYNRALFKSLMRRMSVDVYGSVTFGSASDKLSLLGSHESEELPELIHEMLKKSDNVIAGALFKKLGQIYSNKPGSWENGSKAVARILSKQVGVKTGGMRLLDGSGLSANNMATPSQFMQVLQFAYYNNKTSDDFVSSLPIAGVDGTLKHRMKNIARKIRAKTGTISGVASLAGYAMSYNKEPIAFVIIVNGDKGLSWRYRSMEDKIATALTRYRPVS